MLAGAVLAVLGITLLHGVAQFAVACLGVAVVGFALIRALYSDDDYHRPEPPVPPGAPGPGG